MNKKVKVKQHDITDCGAACLASIAAHYNLRIPVARIRQFASTDKRGTNVLGLIEAAEKLGFTAKGVKGPFESLEKIPKPAIMHVIVKEVLHHFVVFYGITKKHVIVMDPADGKIYKKTHEQFRKEWTGIIVLLVPSEEFKTGNSNESIGKRFIRLLAPHKTVMTQAFFGAAIYSLLGLTTSLYVKNIVDHVLIDGNLNLLSLMSMVMIVVLVLKVYISFMKSIFALKTGQKIDATLILGYYKHLLTLPQRFFDTMRVGEIISRVNDAVKIRTFINNVSLDIVVNILIVVFTLGLMFVFSWKLALVVLIGIPLYFIVYAIFNKLNKLYLRTIMESAAELESHLVESLNGVATIKQFGTEYSANIKSETRFVQLLRSTYKSSKNSIISINASELIAGGLTIAVLWYGSVLVVNQGMTAGKLLSFYALLGYIISPIAQLISSNQTIQDAIIAADRLFQIMDLEREEDKENKIILTKELIEDIHFKDVSFRYGTRVQVFEKLTLQIPKGKTTAFIGESGSGKTSLVALIQKLYPLQSGSIEIGNYNLQHIENNSLRQLIGVVPQKIELFAGSVIENIAFGSFEPDMKQIIDICDFLNIREFIENLPGGFNSYLGEHGVSLSGGERQRIAIARALYHNPEILILDEATSALDSASEEYIKKAIDVMKQQHKTIILIAHRLSTVMQADKICVLHKGNLVEEGDHYGLMQKQSYYFNMWKQQIPILEDVFQATTVN
ncbi:MAG: peptidase domain-containing ABC transporter [Bacteroidota bacterium]|nr:MAG: peptidase domain-containing ABC transporter [Bacteroidota bacterium]